MTIKDLPHRRLNQLTGEWVLVSPHRASRPWQGQVEEVPHQTLPQYDPDCYLCPGNKRAGGVRNPKYESTFVLTNDFSALLPDIEVNEKRLHPLLQSQDVRGTCRVICFSSRHDLTLPEMKVENIQKVINVWIEQSIELGRSYQYVQIFENKGEIMGCSNPHPHGQIWASNRIPNEPSKEDAQQKKYYSKNRTSLLVDYTNEELTLDDRVVVKNNSWIALVPYWAIWPYEILLLPKRQILRLSEISEQENNYLASILKSLLTIYDNLFEIPFPYSMGWHAAPFLVDDISHWQLHAHFYPPLLRSATVKKFMVGYEMLAEAQRDLTPEEAAQRLRELPHTHYKHK